jgi:hypothetical protein
LAAGEPADLLALYFVSLWIAWLLAVKLTEPKASEQAAR